MASNRQRLAAALLACLMLALAGCFGGGDEEKKKPPIGDGKGFKVKPSLLAAGDSALAAGEAESYVPQGELVADSGFRPETDGFAFENYTNVEGVQNLTPAEVESLFGDQVCLSGTGAECELIPAANEWMDNANETMAGGHCMGFSVAALRMFNEDIEQEDYGDDQTVELEIIDNAPLQGSIAEHFVYQMLDPIVENTVEGKPSEVLEALMEALDSGEELYTIGIFKADGSGGHAITPYAVEDKGGGKFAILNYDNNYPGITRALEVDTNAETWEYLGGTNPANLDEVYQGNAETQTLKILPTTPGDQLQPCPFCSGEETAGEGEAPTGSVLGEDKQYTEVSLGGDPKNHPHLVFTDDEGRRTGVVGGRLLREIPDVEVVEAFASQNWEGAPEPRYRIPEGAEYTISVDGTDLDKATTTNVDLVGNGLVIEVDDIKLEPGQKDEMVLPAGYGITYQSNSEEGVAPSFFAGLVEDDAAYTFAASAVGLEAGSTISLVVEQEEKVVILDSLGSSGQDGENPIFILNLTKADAEGNVFQWQNDELELDGANEEKAGFEYSESPAPGEGLPVIILDKDLDEVDQVEAAPLK